MSASIQSDSDHQHEPEADQNLPDGQGIDRDSDGVINQDDDILLHSTSLLQSISSTVAADDTYQAPLDLAGSKLDINLAHDIDPHGDEQSHHTRPNRWYGADSTWLSWTEDDRLVAQSLDRVRSQDLSIHLYNAYALNASINSPRQSRRARSKGKAPIRPDQTSQDDHPRFLNTPPGWTAWPLPPEHVPREPLLPQTSHGGIYLSQDDYRLSAPLEECIIATTTRIARQRWNARATLPEFPIKRNWGIKVEDEVVDPSLDADIPQASDDEDSPAESDLVETMASGPGSSASESADEPMFTSQAYDLGLDIDEDEGKDDKDLIDEVESSVDQRPVPIVDDEKAKSILLPGTRHILNKIDDLFMGLHQARHVYATVPLRRKLDIPDDEADFTEEHPGTEASSDANRGRGRKRKRGRSVSVATNVSARSKSTDSGGGKERKDRWRTLHPRGWSDVVGMAALTGWDPAVIERASQRCANLFGQNMLFRTFHEGDRARNQDSYFTEFEALDNDDDDDDEDGNDLSRPESRFEPPTRMIRTSRPCDECLQQKEICKAQDAVLGDTVCKRCQERGISCSGIVAKFLHNHRTCPYLDCARHDLPFRNAYHLQRHLDNVHRDDPLPHPDAAFAVPSIESQFLTQSQLFSSQLHEIICPVTTCPRHKQPFPRGARLYQHIRNMHPDIDIRELKKLESKRRGDKRGRYRDESRRSQVGRANRSRSKSVVPPADTSSSSAGE